MRTSLVWGPFLRVFLLLALVKMPCPQAQQTHPVSAPAWAQPGSATHTQVAPPPDFSDPVTTSTAPISVFDGQSDIGGALVPARASFNAGLDRIRF